MSTRLTSLGNHLRSTIVLLNSNCNQNCPYLLFVYSFLILLCMHSALSQRKWIIPQNGNMLSLVNDSLSTSGALVFQGGSRNSQLTLNSGMGHPHFMIQSVPDIMSLVGYPGYAILHYRSKTVCKISPPIPGSHSTIFTIRFALLTLHCLGYYLVAVVGTTQRIRSHITQLFIRKNHQQLILVKLFRNQMHARIYPVKGFIPFKNSSLQKACNPSCLYTDLQW